MGRDIIITVTKSGNQFRASARGLTAENPYSPSIAAGLVAEKIFGKNTEVFIEKISGINDETKWLAKPTIKAIQPEVHHE